MKSIYHHLAGMALLTLANIASAHITLEYQVAPANSYYKATFKVGHGCHGSATRQIIATIPTGVQDAKPMPKTGWSLEITRALLATPYSSHGKTLAEDVTRIAWTAKTPADVLPDAQYDEFVIQARMPSAAGMLYWPVQQICEQGRADWVEIPKPGQPLSELKLPAAVLEILPTASHDHNH